MRLGLGPLGAEAGQAVIIAAGISTTLSGLAYGGVPPYTYGWSPATGLSDLALPDPVASPTLTTTYTFRATDSAGNTATDTVTVTVVTVPRRRCPQVPAVAGPSRRAALPP